MTRTKKRKARSQTCLDGRITFGDLFDEPDLYESVVLDTEAFSARSLSLLTTEQSSCGAVLKFQKAFNQMVADAHGNIFIGTDKYIRYISYNQSRADHSKYKQFRQQEKSLFSLKSDEHLVALWNQDGTVYFATMPYALQDYREYSQSRGKGLEEEWSLTLYVADNHSFRQASIASGKHGWIPPSTKDKMQFNKVATFRWKIRGRFVENFLSMWFDDKHKTLITLAECDRQNEPRLIFLHERNDKGLKKLKIRSHAHALFSSDDTHDDGSANQLLIRHKPTRSWLCCISCVESEQKSEQKEQKSEEIAQTESAESEADGECWIQFRLNRESNEIKWSQLIRLPSELRQKKWLCYDEHRDCLIGIKRLRIEELLEQSFPTKIELTVVPRLTKLLQQNATRPIRNVSKKSAKGTKLKAVRTSVVQTRFRSHSHKQRN